MLAFCPDAALTVVTSAASTGPGHAAAYHLYNSDGHTTLRCEPPVDGFVQRPYDGRVIRIKHAQMRWELAPEFEALLPQLLQQSGEPVKISSATTVMRHRLAGREFYLKRYFHERRGLAPVAYFIRADKCLREWTHAPLLQQRGVAVVPHLAHGERWSGRGLMESALVSEGPAGYESLTALADVTAAEIQHPLGEFVRRMHDAGVLYLDISRQNVLYSAHDRAFCLIDVDKVSVHSSLTDERRRENLAFFQSFMPLTAAFFEGYGHGFVAHASVIARHAEAIRQARLRQWARRCLAHTNRVGVHRLGGLKWHVRLEFLDDQLRRLLASPDGAANGFVVHRMRFRSAKAAYREAYHRELCGQRTARPVAAADKRVLGIVWRGYFIAKMP